MIILMTGVPGASKTINTIKFINEDDQFKGRPVFYHNIREVKKTNEKGVEILHGDWTELDNERALKWYELPKGSVVVFDECQDLFPVNTSRRGAPDESLSMFAKHRHAGIDVFLITQESRNIDSFVRRLVNLHRHHSRHFGTHKLKIHEWQNRCSENVHDYHEKLESKTIQSSIDKKYFGVYHSAEVHTQKARLPIGKLALVFLPLFIIPLLVYFAWDAVRTNEATGQVVYGDESSTADVQPVIAGFALMSDYKPRIDGMPWTAPVYDEVREVKQYPWPNCVIRESTGDCNCYSQQATKMSVDQHTCTNIVRNGIFDNAKGIPDGKGEGSQVLAERSQPQADYPKRSYLIKDSTPERVLTIN